MNTNTLGTLTRKPSQKQKTHIENTRTSATTTTTNQAKTDLDKSINNSLENINAATTKDSNNVSMADADASINLIPQSSPSHLIQTDSSDSPNPLITSTASLSSSSSSSNNANTQNNNDNNLLPNHCSVKKRVWTPVTQNNSLSHVKQNELTNGLAPTNLSEVCYFNLS